MSANEACDSLVKGLNYGTRAASQPRPVEGPRARRREALSRVTVISSIVRGPIDVYVRSRYQRSSSPSLLFTHRYTRRHRPAVLTSLLPPLFATYSSGNRFLLVLLGGRAGGRIGFSFCRGKYLINDNVIMSPMTIVALLWTCRDARRALSDVRTSRA